MNKLKKIAVFTAIRSEYSAIKPLLKYIQQEKLLQLHLLVGGAHLTEKFGNTQQQIQNDSFDIAATFPFLQADEQRDAPIRAMALLQLQIGQYFANNPPDIILLVGDRFELLAVASAALVLNIPIAHISGGEVTEGAIDNQVRHAISKMAHLHFPAMNDGKENLLKMGEESWRIKVVGEPGLDQIANIEKMTREQFAQDVNLQQDKPFVLATFHPETINNAITADFVVHTLESIIKKYPMMQILVTAANFDPGGNEINQAVHKVSRKNKHIVFYKNLGQKHYYSALNLAECMIGNSSSGLIEAQSFNLPVINVGDRQQGRIANPNVLHVPSDTQQILKAIETVSTDKFKQKFLNKPNIYGDGHACQKIVEHLKNVNQDALIMKKSTW